MIYITFNNHGFFVWRSSIAISFRLTFNIMYIMYIMYLSIKNATRLSISSKLLIIKGLLLILFLIIIIVAQYSCRDHGLCNQAEGLWLAQQKTEIVGVRVIRNLTSSSLNQEISISVLFLKILCKNTCQWVPEAIYM